MKVTNMKMIGTWRDVADAARTTVGKESGKGEPPSSWKKKILLAEHSPIRKLMFSWTWEDLPYWVSVHLVRHKFGIEHFVSTQRSDRTGKNRNEKPQNAPVKHSCIANAQALISISRKRLCACASPETREAWSKVIQSLIKIAPEVAEVCVPECGYRGFCPEIKSCGFVKTKDYNKCLKDYRTIW